MNYSATDANVYTDFQGLGRLRAQARTGDSGALRAAAQQFEGLMLQTLLKSMRQTSLGGGLMDSKQGEFYRDLHDRQLALHLSGQGSLGIADLLVRQLGQKGAAPEGRSLKDYRDLAVLGRPAVAPAPFSAPISVTAPSALASAPAAPGTAGPATGSVSLDGIDGPRDFIERLWPLAERAARRIGARPEALLAQAALETGWGRKVIRQADGHSSNNLFGIKADGRWSGERVQVGTLEYKDGIAVRQQAAFRAYGSPQESFDDYADFLRDNPRYAPVLERAADPGAFATALQEAGYATDPRYAEKIRSILGREELRSRGGGQG